ncbi:tetratricopeptide repeat protein [Taklimakanibacter lacteus]|uniref:tetratricopeptide repeat protein n=1 Tax=Taklimakanibacter lacteus TaxID=2268456 RepID=UPI000E6716E6
MFARTSVFGLALTAGLTVLSDYSLASDLEQCEAATAGEQQRQDACDRVMHASSASPRDRARALVQLGRLVRMKPDGFSQWPGMLDAAVAADPTYVPAILNRAEWFIFETKGHDAVRLLEPALASNPRNVELLVMLGRANAALQLPDRALQFFSEALDEDPHHMRASYEAGQAYEMVNEYKHAAEAYRKAGESYDPSYVSQGWLGIEDPNIPAARIYNRLGEVDKAAALLTTAIDRSPVGLVQANVFEARASYYQALGRDEEAIADLTSALRKANPDEHMPLLFKRSILYQRTGKSREAEEDIGRALRSGDRRTVLRMQVYLRNQGYTEVTINGVADPGLMKLISACFATPKCSDGLGSPI